MKNFKLSPALAASVAATVCSHPGDSLAQETINYTNSSPVSISGTGKETVSFSQNIPYADKLLSISGGSLSGGEGCSFTLSVEYTNSSTQQIYSGEWSFGATYQLTNIPSETFATGTIDGLVFDIVNLGGVSTPQITIPAGTVFKFATPSLPALTIVRQHTNVVVSWPTNAPGFTLQFTTNLAPALWNTVTPTPVITGSNYITTNSLTPTNHFYRLFQ